MNRSIGLWQLCGFSFTALAGTLLHFLYDFTGGAAWAALFSGVNESTWEHMKLLFVPMLAFAVFEFFFFREREDFWCVKLRGILLGIGLIPIIFCTYNGVIGKSPDWVNIAIFFLAAAAAYLYEAVKLEREDIECPSPRIAVAILCALALIFVLFSFRTPELAIFKDPLTGEYGVWTALLSM